jgi:hypothetical protein
MKVLFLTSDHLGLVEEFCKQADQAGYKNNSSIALMKFNGEYDLREVPRFWGLVKDEKLVSVSGCHRWRGKGPLDGVPFMMRCLFRSATLPEHQNIIPGISKNHMNSIPFSILLPYQINDGLRNGVRHFYITTSNTEHDASGKMKRTHRALQLLEKNKVVKYAGDEIFYSTSQTKWEIDLNAYLSALRSFHPMREKLNIDLSEEYYKIIEHGFDGEWGGVCTPIENNT